MLAKEMKNQKTHYITTDLVVKTNHEVDALVQALEAAECVVNKHEWTDHKWFLNVSGPGRPSPSASIKSYCDIILALPSTARQQWDAAGFKEFFLGYEAGEEPHCHEDHLPNTLIHATNALGAGIGIAIYPARDEPPEIQM
jgi:hypothetical protein